MVILGVDLGSRRTGVAVSDGGGRIAFGLETIEEPDRKRLAARLAALAEERGAGRIVVGLPLNMDGTKGPKAREAEEFAAELGSVTDAETVLWDERLTSVAAERSLDAGGLGRKKKKKSVDRVAAQLILQSHLDSLGNRGE